MCVCVQGCELKAAEMPAGWRSAAGVYKLQYSHPLCGNSLALVVAVSMGPTLVINGEFMIQQLCDQIYPLKMAEMLQSFESVSGVKINLVILFLKH